MTTQALIDRLRAENEMDAAAALERLYLENEKLRQGLADKVVSETLLREMSVQNGGLNMTLEGGAARLFAASFVDQFRESGASNYLEMSFHVDNMHLLVTLQRVAGKTPAQFRKEAEKSLASLEALAQPVVASWSDGAPVDEPMQALALYFKNKQPAG